MFDPATDMYSYRPLPHWEQLISRLGELAGQPEGNDWRPLFDLVKQLATSRLSVTIHPSLIDGILYLSNGPIHHDPLDHAHLRIDWVGGDAFVAQVVAERDGVAFPLSFTRSEALPTLTSVLGML